MSGAPQHDDKPLHVPGDHGMRRYMADWRPSRRVLLVVLLAFAVGLLLFLLLWWRDRGTNDFYRARTPPGTSQGQVFEPLPAPLPAGSDNAAGRLGQDETASEQARNATVEPAPVPPPVAPAAPRPPAAQPGVTLAPADSPVPISAPAPGYPPDAFRRGESGTVLLRVHVGPDGIPYAVDLVRSSHSRSLDRAASDAVKRWRFRPAQRNGQPVAADVQVPITFNADR
jgi:protein TonB